MYADAAALESEPVLRSEPRLGLPFRAKLRLALALRIDVISVRGVLRGCLGPQRGMRV
jgi:hypothetical protein